jgi:ATP-dependent Clp protease ATP-binding subunit ClpC
MSDRPFTTRALRSLELADACSARLGHAYIGTEQMLIGLLEEETGPAAQVLKFMGVTVDTFRATWQQQVGTAL